jgi:hypothetical protein
MEPKSLSSERMPDVTPNSNELGEFRPEVEQPSVERSNEKGIERGQEAHHATTASAAQAAQIALPTPIPQVDDAAAAPADDSSPATAADDDLIEKEWVDKAKQIIAETRDDPHSREKAVNKLQADYLRKRYGKELGEDS